MSPVEIIKMFHPDPSAVLLEAATKTCPPRMSDMEERWLAMATGLSAVLTGWEVCPRTFNHEAWAGFIDDVIGGADWLGCGVEVRNALKGI